jgi:ABC-type uncharacterized transport system substrate-binding protein
MKRRDVMFLLGGAALASPISVHAQQTAMPSIGFVSVASPRGSAQPLSGFHKGLGETGYVEGHNVTIEYRWAEGRKDRLPAMVADLVHRHVAVLVAPTTAAALAAKAATTTIPIVFEIAYDPIRSGSASSPALTGRAATSRG